MLRTETFTLAREAPPLGGPAVDCVDVGLEPVAVPLGKFAFVRADCAVGNLGLVRADDMLMNR